MSNGIDLSRARDIVSDILSKRDVRSIAFVGCGASSAELYPAYYFLKDASTKLRPFHFTANEFDYDTPAWVDEHCLVLTCSLGGNTPETVAANDVAHQHGAAVVAVTHKAESPLAKDADYVITHGFEANYAAKLEKMGYVLDVALELLQQVEGYEHYDAMIDGLTKIFDHGERSAQQAKGLAAKFGRDFKSDPIIYYMSSGASLDVAYSESVCLMMEMQWINSGNFSTGDFFHGPFEIVDKDVPFVLMMNEGNTRHLDERALTFLHRFNAKVGVVDTKDYDLADVVAPEVITYFNPFIHTAVFRTYAEALSKERNHPLTLRRYMWKLEY